MTSGEVEGESFQRQFLSGSLNKGRGENEKGKR